MALAALRNDALASTPDGFRLRISLPWIRSLPLASLRDVELSVDDTPVDALRVHLGAASLPIAALADETAWWFLQDRVELHGSRTLEPGSHVVRLSFELTIPYLPAGPDAPCVLPFAYDEQLMLDANPTGDSVSRVVGADGITP